MASVILIGRTHRAQVRVAGKPPLTKSFSEKKYGTLAAAEREANAWAALQETNINSGARTDSFGKKGILLGDAIDRYAQQKQEFSKTVYDILERIKSGMGHLVISKLTDDDIVSYIESRNFGPTTGSMHFSILCTVLKMARVGWKYHVPEVTEQARERLRILGLIGSSKPRTRRPTENEINKLLAYDFKGEVPMTDIIRFAMSSAMRRAEITRIKWATFDEVDKTILITDRKHPKIKKGNHQTVPLLDASIDIIKRQPKKEGDDNVFPFDPRTIGNYFTLACTALGIVDLHFHDLRHEGTSRLFEMGYGIEEVQQFTGHQDWKMLKRYTHLKAKNVRRLEQQKSAPIEIKGDAVVMDEKTLEQFKQFQAMLAMMKQTETA